MAGDDDETQDRPSDSHASTVRDERRAGTVVQGKGSTPSLPTSPSSTASILEVLSESSFGARYTTKEELGVGGMGQVLLCHDRRTGRSVALKRPAAPRRGGDTSSGPTPRFLREARVHACLEHPAIVPVYDLGVDDARTPYFTMKCIRGLTLAEIIAKLAAGDEETARTFTRRKLLEAFATVCLAVDFAHTKGIVHRDLKPANIMLGSFGEVYVLDWGIASDPSRGPATAHGAPPLGDFPPSTVDDAATVEGSLLGTPAYMSPEQLSGNVAAISPRSDVYALGAILFEILALERLVDGKALLEIAAQVGHGVDARPSVRAPARDIPPELDAICVAATAKHAEDRLPSARHVHQLVEAYLEGDRDLSLRRELAQAHAERAATAARRALEGPLAGDEGARRTALHEAGRAMALDPDNASAAGTILALLARVPPELPPEVADELARARDRSAVTASRLMAYGVGGMFGFLPLMVWMGIHDMRLVIASGVLALLGLVAHLRIILRGRSSPALLTFVAITAMLLTATMTRTAGPLIASPVFACGTVVTLLAHPSVRRRWLVLTAGCLGFVGPLVFEWLGLLDPSYTFSDRGILVVPHALGLPALPTTVFVTLSAVASIVATGQITGRLRDALTRTEADLHLQAWQLRQIVPAPGDEVVRRPVRDRT